MVHWSRSCESIVATGSPEGYLATLLANLADYPLLRPEIIPKRYGSPIIFHSCFPVCLYFDFILHCQVRVFILNFQAVFVNLDGLYSSVSIPF